MSPYFYLRILFILSKLIKREIEGEWERERERERERIGDHNERVGGDKLVIILHE